MPAHRLRSAVHPGGALVPPPADPIEPIVRVTPFVNGVQKATGTGFWIEPWPSTMITARHVVQGATAVRILARKLGGGAVAFDAATVACADGPSDIAMLCTLVPANVPERLHLGVPEAPGDTVFRGFPWNVAPATSAPIPVTTRARLDRPWLRLSHGGQGGMSGSPVISREADSMDLVFGVYVGPHGAAGPSALATDEPLFNTLMLAAVALRDEMRMPA